MRTKRRKNKPKPLPVLTFSQRLRRLHDNYPLNQGDLAVLMGVSKPTICLWLAEKRKPRPRRMAELLLHRVEMELTQADSQRKQTELKQ